MDPRKSIEIFTTFCDYFLICVHGKKDFKELAKYKNISTIISVSTEAYTIAYLDNSWDNWLAEAKDTTAPKSKEREKSRKEYPNKRWTADQQASKRYGGWHNDGLEVYNNLQLKVHTERQSGEHHELEDQYKEHARSWFQNKKWVKKVRIEDIGVTVDIYPSPSDDEGEEEEDKDQSEVDDGESSEDDNCVE